MNKRIKQKQRAEALNALTPEERLLLKLYQQSDYARFHSHGKTEEEATRIVSILGKPERDDYDGQTWFSQSKGKIEVTAFKIKEKA